LETRFHKRQVLFLVVKTVKCKRAAFWNLTSLYLVEILFPLLLVFKRNSMVYNRVLCVFKS